MITITIPVEAEYSLVECQFTAMLLKVVLSDPDDFTTVWINIKHFFTQFPAFRSCASANLLEYFFQLYGEKGKDRCTFCSGELRSSSLSKGARA